MLQFRSVPFAGGSYADETKPWTQQETVNLIPTRAEREGAVSPMILKQAPGLRTLLQVGEGPIRGLYNAEGRLLAVSGQSLYWVKTDLSVQLIGTLPGFGRVSIAHNQVTNGNQVLFATGDAGYVYDTAAATFGPVTDPGYPGAMCVRFLGQYLVQIAPSRKYLFHSDLADAFNYNTIDRYAAEGLPDKLYSLEVNGGRLLAMGERSIEVYDNIVTDTAAFARSGNVIDRGVAGPWASCVLDSAVIFLGNDGIVYRMDGYTPVRISHHPLETAMRGADLRRAFFQTWESDGHKVAYFTLPTVGTWGYDVASGEFHRRRSHALPRWRANALVSWNGMQLAGDYQSGRIMELVWGHPWEVLDPIERLRTFAVMHNQQNQVRVNGVRLLIDSGGPSPAPVDVEAPEPPVIEPVSSWKYLIVEPSADTGDSEGYADPDFNDAEWADGASPFASSVPHPHAGAVGWPQIQNTEWPLDTNLWLRAHFNVEVPVDLVFKVFVDNFVTVWINGELAMTRRGTISTPSGPIFNHSVDVPASALVVGDNVIAVLGEDYGSFSYMACSLEPA